MKVIIIALCFVYGVAPAFIPVLQRTHSVDPSGQFSSSYQSADGTRAHEQGVFKPSTTGTDKVLVKQGYYSYLSPDGKPITVSYIADELGFRVSGNHLPQSPASPHTPSVSAAATFPSQLPAASFAPAPVAFVPQVPSPYFPQAPAPYVPQAPSPYVPQAPSPYVPQAPFVSHAPGAFSFVQQPATGPFV